jgi:hypothetical protein
METDFACWPAARKGQSRPVDLVHLSRYTLGEMALEQEVLQGFCTKAAIDLERLRHAPSALQWKHAARSLKASAQRIGAWPIATAAERAESLRDAALSETRDAQLRELEASLREAKAFIEALL